MKKSQPPFFRVLWMTWVMGMLSVMTVSAADESVSGRRKRGSRWPSGGKLSGLPQFASKIIDKWPN